MLLQIGLVAFSLAASIVTAAADARCFVRAPGDATALRVRPEATRAVVSVPNGTQVSMWRIERHAGQRWAYVTLIGLDGAGYLPRDFLICS